MSEGAENIGTERAAMERQPAGGAVVIPEKLYFKIGEVCAITGVRQHVLRYWETEFPILRPQRARSKQRLYRRVDVENVLLIKRLLREKGFTISGARKMVAGERQRAEPVAPVESMDGNGLMEEVKAGLLALKELLEKL